MQAEAWLGDTQRYAYEGAAAGSSIGHALSSMQVLQARLCSLCGSHVGCAWSAQSSHTSMYS